MTIRVRFAYSFVVCVASVFLLTSAVRAQTLCPFVTSSQTSPDVVTWHYDNCRTGWQQNEASLSANLDNPNDCNGTGEPAVLHAFDATSMQQLYTSSGNSHITSHSTYPTPTIFEGRVYAGTWSEVDVFGLCSGGPNGTCLN